MVCKVVPSIPGSPGGARGAQELQTQEEADYETALDTAGYGRFSQLTLGACACAFFTTGVQNCVMSYVLPAARCELSLTTYQSGLVNMAFMCGGVASAFFWGIAGDVFGRRNILSMTLLLDSVILLAQSTIIDYRLLLAARSINGFLIGGPSTLVFSYLSDLVGVRRRQLYLNITGMSFVAAWLILPAIAWLVIPIRITYSTILPIYSWRLYLALGSLPGFLCGFWFMLLPESPRLLADTDRADEALKIFKKIYKINGGKEKDFKIKKLIAENMYAAKTFSEEHSAGRMKELFTGVLRDLKIFVSKGYALKSSLILLVFFANMAAGFGLNMWIPELLLRMQTRECQFTAAGFPETSRLVHPNNTLWKQMNQRSGEFGKWNSTLHNEYPRRRGGEKCNDDIDGDIFTSGLIVGACCVILNGACMLVSRGGGGGGSAGGARGVRSAAAACALCCALACACLALCVCSCTASNKVAVAAAAALNAASLNGNVLLIRLLLFALPPKLSGLGVCWGAWWGRAGGVASNLAVGVLLDYSCPAPFVSVAALIAVSIVGIMMIKLEETKEVTTAENKKEENGTPKIPTLDGHISTHM